MTKEELEKEAEEWLRKYLLCCNCEKKCNCIDSNSYCEEQVLKSYVAGAEPREKRIVELEKENAELRKKNLSLQDAVDMQMYTNKANKEMAKIQLTKAKELLERLLITSCNSDVLNLLPNCSEVLKVRVEAEQFLKESEVEK